MGEFRGLRRVCAIVVLPLAIRPAGGTSRRMKCGFLSFSCLECILLTLLVKGFHEGRFTFLGETERFHACLSRFLDQTGSFVRPLHTLVQTSLVLNHILKDRQMRDLEKRLREIEERKGLGKRGSVSPTRLGVVG